MIAGTLVALISPFCHDAVDEQALRTLVRHCLTGGVDGLVPCGTTGEGASLSDEEFGRILEVVREEVGDNFPVIAGCGSNSTVRTRDRALIAREHGASGLLVVTPYYVRPTQEGLRGHFLSIAESCDLPLILYNVPSRTGCDLLPETVFSLAEHPLIVGIKEATGSMRRAFQLLHGLPDSFSLLSGDDFTALAFVLSGGHGVISVTANVVPDLFSEMIREGRTGNAGHAQALNKKLYGLMDALFWETNPIPVKKALQHLCIGNGQPRLPLVDMSTPKAEQLYHVMLENGFIQSKRSNI